MGQALYRKYRSKSLNEIVGQEHITTTLSNALKLGKISHAYLFTGPRGVGKTSIARILAYEVNGLPYNEEATHLDIIEIDAASNRRIDEIRELREKVHTVPSSARYKVYIIDEVHMLTREAFNALLKTLEEPPAHAIFILATTEAHKIPDTITSRTQRFTFRPISVSEQIAHLQTIAKKEKINVDNDALELIAKHSGGSFRDSISLLDQARSSAEHVTLSTVENILGIAPLEAVQQLADLALEGTPAQILKQVGLMRQTGHQAAQLAVQLSLELRQRLVNISDLTESKRLSSILFKLLSVPASHDPMNLLELILLESTLHSGNAPSEVTKKTLHVTQKKPTSLPEDKVMPVQEAKNDTSPLEATEPQANTSSKQTNTSKSVGKNENGSPFDSDSWQKVLQVIKTKNNTLYGIARIAIPTFSSEKITLSFRFPFHQKRFNEPKTKQLISDIIHEQTGHKMTITCIVGEASSEPRRPNQPSEPVDDVLTNISNIFGDAEVLE